MKNKIKIVSLMLALSSLVFSAEPSKYNSELMVTGDGIRERVDYTFILENITMKEMENIGYTVNILLMKVVTTMQDTLYTEGGCG